MLSTKNYFNWDEVIANTGFPGKKRAFLLWLRECKILDEELKPTEYFLKAGFIEYKWAYVGGDKEVIYSWSTLKGLNFLIQLVDTYYKKTEDGF